MRKRLITPASGSPFSRFFNGNGEIRFAIGAAASVPTGALAWGCVFRPTDPAHAGGLISVYQAGSRQLGCNPFSTGDIFFAVNGFVNAGPYAAWVADGVCLWFTKAAGAGQQIRAHVFPYSTGVWSHANLGAVDAGGAGDEIVIGQFNAGQFYRGYLVAQGLYAANLSDGDIEGAGVQYRIAPWLSLTNPRAVWAFGQTSEASPVQDLTGGGANQTAITNTTAALWLPTGWSYS